MPVFLERRQRVARGQAVQPRLEADLCRKDGAQIPVELSVTSLLHDGQVVGSVTVVRDVRAWQQSEVQLHQTQQPEAMGLLAGGFAHHFNNMLMGILGFTELMLAEEASGSARWNNLQHVFTAALRARDLVLQLLMFSRPTPLLRRPVHLRERDAGTDVARHPQRHEGDGGHRETADHRPACDPLQPHQ